MKILISTSSFGKADSAPLDLIKSKAEVILNPYGRKLTTQEFIDLTSDVDGVIAGVEDITKDALSARPNIKVISRCGVGMDNVDIEACNELGIKLYNTPNAPVGSVAELTVTFILTLLKNVIPMNGAVKAGNWSKMSGFMLSGKKVGIIGMGRIGRKVSELLSSFDVEIAYTDIKDFGIYYKYMSKNELLEWADIITLHCSANSESGYVIDEQELKCMKSSAYLVNTSRGKFINEEALYEYLSENRIAGAALDVFSVEPYKGKLSTLNNVILTPHISSSAKEGRVVMEIEAVNNLLKGLGIK